MSCGPGGRGFGSFTVRRVNMKKIVVVSALLASFICNVAWAKCAKKDAEEKVNWACGLIESKGKEALPEINKMRYCGDNYVWIQDTADDIKMVQHPTKPKLNGQSIKEQRDENKFQLFYEFHKMATAKPAGGWVDYVWAKPGAEKATPKTSFVKLCKGGQKWVAGSGVWKDDI
jgi:signal transduction histidine kinase